jgi:hypothetical protein
MGEKPKIGILAIDRSGSRSNYPIIVAAVYSNKVGNFERAVKEIKDKFKIDHEKIKGKDFKPTLHRKILEVIQSHNIKFVIYLVDGKIYSQLRNIYWREKWEQKLEAVLWYKACVLLLKRVKVIPQEIFYEKTYTANHVFDDLFKILLKEKFNLEEVSVGSKYSPYIMVADWIANFFHKNPNLKNYYKSNVVKCELKYIEETLWKILIKKEKSGSHPVGGPTAKPGNDQTINNLFRNIFKVFGCSRELIRKRLILFHTFIKLFFNPEPNNSLKPSHFFFFSLPGKLFPFFSYLFSSNFSFSHSLRLNFKLFKNFALSLGDKNFG